MCWEERESAGEERAMVEWREGKGRSRREGKGNRWEWRGKQ